MGIMCVLMLFFFLNCFFKWSVINMEKKKIILMFVVYLYENKNYTYIYKET